MRPEARIAAAAEILDRIAAGTPAERALTTWARGNRFAGAKDRAAIRTHVFDALRRRSSLARWGGGTCGRALMIGALRAAGRDPGAVFTGEAYAPAPLTPTERAHAPGDPERWPRAERLDYPAWLDGELDRSLGPALASVMEALRHRAPVFLRANLAKTTPAAARAALAEDGVAVTAHPLSDTALLVSETTRSLRATRAVEAGLVEFQDAASQAVVEALGPPRGAGRALDFCAGGGGKALALAARGWSVTAHDADPGRMADLPIRAGRAGVEIARAEPGQRMGAFDLVLADAPCSGSGAWRRQPAAKWTLTPERLAALEALQDEVLGAAAAHVASGGRLAYATCSLLRRENEDRIAAFRGRAPAWRVTGERRFSPLDGGDGFYLAILEKA